MLHIKFDLLIFPKVLSLKNLLINLLDQGYNIGGSVQNRASGVLFAYVPVFLRICATYHCLVMLTLEIIAHRSYGTCAAVCFDCMATAHKPNVANFRQ